MAKTKTPIDEKLANVEFDLFEALAAIDRKDYGYYDRLTDEQRQRFNPYMLIKWLTYVKAKKEVQQFYLLAGNEFANKHLFSEIVGKHGKLQWLMLCAASPQLGKQFRQYLPQLSEKISKLKVKANIKEIKDYYSKVYPNADQNLLTEISEVYVIQHNKKVYLANKFPEMSFEDIETLSELITDNEIQEYEKAIGN